MVGARDRAQHQEDEAYEKRLESQREYYNSHPEEADEAEKSLESTNNGKGCFAILGLVVALLIVIMEPFLCLYLGPREPEQSLPLRPGRRAQLCSTTSLASRTRTLVWHRSAAGR